MKNYTKAALLIITILAEACTSYKNTVYIKESKQKFTTVQEALDAAGSGKTIIIGPGEYKTSKAIWVRNDNVTIIGKKKPQILCTSMDANVFWIDGKNIILKNITARHIKPDFYAECVGNVITVDVADGVLIENCDLNGCGRVGIYVQGGVNIVVKNCFIHDNTVSALNINGVPYNGETSDQSSIITFNNNRFEKNGSNNKEPEDNE